MKNEFYFCGEQQPPEFIKYPRIPYIEQERDILGRECYLFEKIDGSLCQVRRTEKGIMGGSKSKYISGLTKRPHWAQDFLKWMHSNPSLYNLKPELIMFGEWLEPVTIDYDEEFLKKFYFLDLAHVVENEVHFFDYDEALGYFYKWGINGIECLPPIGKKFLDEDSLREVVMGNQSYLRGKNSEIEIGNEMEGVVIKNYEIGKFAKCLHPKYSEIREEEKTLEEKYLTEIRVKKSIRRLNDEGNLNPSLDELVEEVIRDINNEICISFRQVAVKGVIRAKNLYAYKNNNRY